MVISRNARKTRSRNRPPNYSVRTCVNPKSPTLNRSAQEGASNKSAHLRGGIRKILEFPSVYGLFNILIRSKGARIQFVKEIIPAKSGSRILDIGCGDGWILEFLPDSVSYVGYDLNPDYIDRARSLFGQRATFVCAAISADSAPRVSEDQFDIVLALGVLHHLSDAEAANLCEQAYSHLAVGGVFITYDGVFVPEQSRVARFLLSRDRGQAVRTPEGYLALASKRFSNVTSQVRSDMLRIPYTNFIMHCVRES